MAVGVWSTSVPARAQRADAASPASASSAPLAAREHANRAKIVLVGALARDRELAALLRELLGADGIELELLGAERFEPDALFAAAESDAILAFIRLHDARDARLHFRAPGGKRFLLRKAELPSGVDAVGRELLGQIVKSSIAVLLHSPKGLSRAEASAALARDDAPREAPAPRTMTATPAAAPHGTRTSPLEQGTPPAPSKQAPWAFGLNASYSAEWTSSDLSIAHGPGAAFGARSRSTPQWGVRLAGHWFFPQEVQGELVGANVQRTDVQLLFELAVPLARSQFASFGLGPSLEVSFLEPTIGAPDVALSDPKTDVAPALRAEARYELEVGPLVLGAMTFVNVSLVRTHYDVLDQGVLVRVVTVGAVRPGVALTLGLM